MIIENPLFYRSPKNFQYFHKYSKILNISLKSKISKSRYEIQKVKFYFFQLQLQGRLLSSSSIKKRDQGVASIIAVKYR